MHDEPLGITGPNGSKPSCRRMIGEIEIRRILSDQDSLFSAASFPRRLLMGCQNFRRCDRIIIEEPVTSFKSGPIAPIETRETEIWMRRHIARKP